MTAGTGRRSVCRFYRISSHSSFFCRPAGNAGRLQVSEKIE